VLRQNTKRLIQPFETRQGLRQGDVLFTLLFNVVLEIIVRRANLQTTGTIYNKETQLLASRIVLSFRAVRDAYLALKIETAKVGLKIINEQKTKYMIAVRMIGRFVTWGKLWQLATNTLKSSKNS
jgi:hypothetical protein